MQNVSGILGQKFSELWDFHSVAILDLIRNIIAAALIIGIGAALSKAAQRLIKKAGGGKVPVHETVSPLLRIIVRYGIFIICVIMVLNVFGVNTASLIAILGAAGVAVGLALKDTLGNIASGIILLFLGSCRAGEYIEFGSCAGTVKEINLFTTILETPDGLYVSAPNSAVWSSPLKNYTRNGRRRMEISVNIAYSDSIDTAFQVMRDIASHEQRFLTDPAPQVLLHAVQDSSIKITLRAWASNQDYWNVYWDQMRNIKTKIEEAGLHIPLPQRDVRIVKDKA